ncbi:protein LIAT1 [Hippoglossus hippoglossus]|uniref:protein LIAT1 n=1 Tax=Hippoglossus hippoglossus TaxID=8267 RepID=UPI00148D871F|nr:protein LIAT1 [Hippoglossus hippoglossus]
MMPEQHDCDLLQSNSPCDSKKKKKKKKGKRNTASIGPPENTRQEKPHTMPLHPETLPVSLLTPQSAAQPRAPLPKLPAAGKKGGEQSAGSGTRSKKHPKNSPAPLTAANKTSGSGAPAVSELSNQARESLRWEGALEDPQAEEKRLELYRANRRQRYITHRDTVLRESQDAQRWTFPKEHGEKKALTKSVQQETASLQRLSTHLIIEANKS